MLMRKCWRSAGSFVHSKQSVSISKCENSIDQQDKLLTLPTKRAAAVYLYILIPALNLGETIFFKRSSPQAKMVLP